MTARWQNLVNAIRQLPGVGPKMAERLALFLLRSPSTDSFLKAVRDARQHLRHCRLCGIYTEKEACDRCTDSTRDQSLLCVVEEMADLMALEKSGAFKGVYHLLGGSLSPLDGIGPNELRIDSLLKRIQTAAPAVNEVIIATNSTVEGEATATYLAQLMESFGVKLTRLATGLPSGTTLEYADERTLARAFEGRHVVAEVRL